MSVSSRSFLLFLSFFFLVHIFGGENVDDGSSSSSSSITSTLSRLDFPPGFVFGAGNSAYQVEGAAAEDGRKPSMWDTYLHQGNNSDKGNGDIASDQYHKYKEDVKLMHEMGLDAYRFSISWSRLIPDGHGAVNPKGLSYYNNLINELVSYGIKAHVTLNQFDIPQALQDEYGATKNTKFIEHFTAYADVCFKEYGDRVKTWITFNEPNIPGYVFTGVVEPMTAESLPMGHNVLLAHAATVQLYRTKYQEKQKGQIGITLIASWYEPATSSPLDISAAKKEIDYQIGWFMEPLIYGRYPGTMKRDYGSQLPTFAENDPNQIKGSFDFIGLNHYTVYYVQALPNTSDIYGSDRSSDVAAKSSFTNGRLVREFNRLKANGGPVMEWGLQKMLEYVKQKYINPTILIHENGYGMPADDPSSPSTHMDTERIDYLHKYIQTLLSCIRNGSDVRGYFVWALIDCFELFGRYNVRYGLYGVDFNDKDRRRYPRQSAHWYTNFLARTGRKGEGSSYLDTA